MEVLGNAAGAGGTRVVDVRSDTVTLPSEAMKEAMMAAPLGDDVYEEDPTMNALQEKVATLLDMEAALFVPSGTMGNLICVLNHCRVRGSEVLIGHLSHIHLWEQGGVSQLGGVHPRTLTNLPDGTFDLSEMRRFVRGDDIHWPVTRLVCVENTHNMAGGKVLPLSWLNELGTTCRELGLPIHMDGARLFNAAVALQVPVSKIVRDCASVCICLSKSLGSPVGSVIAGSKDFIQGAKRLRKVLGGGMRQVGILAAAGIYALDHVVPTLSRDHDYVQDIARVLAECGGKIVHCDPRGAHTNILFVDCDTAVVTPERLCHRMREVTDEEEAALGERIIVRMINFGETSIRLVVHCNVTHEDIQSLIKKFVYVIKEFESKL